MIDLARLTKAHTAESSLEELPPVFRSRVERFLRQGEEPSLCIVSNDGPDEFDVYVLTAYRVIRLHSELHRGVVQPNVVRPDISVYLSSLAGIIIKNYDRWFELCILVESGTEVTHFEFYSEPSLVKFSKAISEWH